MKKRGNDQSFDVTTAVNTKYIFFSAIINCLLILPFILLSFYNNQFNVGLKQLISLVLFLGSSFFLINGKSEDNGSKLFIISYSLIIIFLLIFYVENISHFIFLLPFPLISFSLFADKKGIILNIIIFILISCRLAFMYIGESIVSINHLPIKFLSVYLIMINISYLIMRSIQSNRKEINSLTFFDDLTGLANDKQLELYLENLILNSKRTKRRFSLFSIDIDHFDRFQDNLGLRRADQIIVRVAERMKQCLRSSDFPSRVGRDEFIAVLPEIDGDVSPAYIAQRMINEEFNLIEKYTLGIKPTLSIGIVNFPDDGEDINALFHNANIAMHEAKEEGGNTFSYFHKEFDNLIKERFEMEKHLKLAILNNELSVVFQPKIDPQIDKVIGAEALIRWNNPALGTVSPSDFIAIAEDSNLIHEISTWVYKEAFIKLAEINKNGFNNIILSVNVSPVQIVKNTLIISLEKALKSSGINADSIELEITEGLILEENNETWKTFFWLREKGFRIAIDDFGTGYSSLSYLKNFNVDSLKIDKSFISIINEDENVSEIVKAIISMAQTLNLQTVAEGVENSTQLDILRQYGCNLIQGFYYSKPLTIEKFIDFLDKNEWKQKGNKFKELIKE